MDSSTNQLIHETSPYLLQHAHNPVDWFPWSDEALQKAKNEDKLIIVSIGYSACHWCHVMERESFEDKSVAKVMNDHFVSIKVDREERPDIDNLYMQAAMIVSGRGGWPLNVVALPDGRPVYGGTYFPQTQWMQLLQYFAQGYQKERGKLEKQADQIAKGIRQLEATPELSQDHKINSDWHQTLLENWLPDMDLDWGGREGAPKFPMPANWLYLLNLSTQTNNEQAERVLTTTLDRMAWGGLYDHIGGGFARYSTDARWHIPHFEKMLYDNGQLLTLYSQAYKRFKSPDYKLVVEQTIECFNRELRSKDGGYFCALDADSEGVEGKYYAYSYDEWQQVLEGASKPMASIYGITEEGNWEDGKNIPFRVGSLSEHANKVGMDEQNFHHWLEEHLQLLHSQRQQRVHPGLDDKILTSWNALMIEGLCSAYEAFGDSSYLQDANHTYQFLKQTAWKGDGSLWRSLKGTPSIPGFLDDHALFAWAACQLYQSTFDQTYINDAQSVIEFVLIQFVSDESPFFFYTPINQHTLVTRQKELSDNVIPSSNSVLARVLHQLGNLLERPDWIEWSVKMMKHMADQAQKQPHFHGNWNQLALDFAYPPAEIAIVGPNAEQVRKELATHNLGNSLVLGSTTPSDLPLLKGKFSPNKTQIFVCRAKVCQRPVSTVQEALMQIQEK